MSTTTRGRVSGRVRRRCVVATVLVCAGSIILSGCAGESNASEPEPFRVHGTEARGTSSKNEAPTLRPGRYTDAAPSANRARHYVVRREQRNSTMHVGFTARPNSPAPDDLVELELWTMSGTQCGQGASRDYDIRRHNSLVTVAVDSANVSRDATPEERRACATATELHLVVLPTYGDSALPGADSELVVLEEPNARNGNGLPAPADGPADWGAPMPMEDRQTVEPGPSFAEAPRLTPGNYRSTLRPGEVRLYRVELNWGQRLRTRTRIPPPSADLVEHLDTHQQVDVRLIAPNRADVGVDDTELPRSSASRIEHEKVTSLTQMTYDVRYRNRNDTERPYVAGAAVPGDYYIAVTMSADPDDESYELPYTLDVAVDDTSDGRDPGYVDDASIAGPVTEQPQPFGGNGQGWVKSLTVGVLLGLGGLSLAFGGAALLISRRALRLA